MDPQGTQEFLEANATVMVTDNQLASNTNSKVVADALCRLTSSRKKAAFQYASCC